MKNIIILTGVLATLLLCASPASAAGRADEWFHRGIVAYQEGNFDRAEKYWTRAAERGQSSAMYSLGRLYQYGDLGEPDLKQAGHWYRQAANQGVTPAKYLLASILFDRGEYDEAATWMSQAAKEDYTRAQHDLALMYEEGKGLQTSPEEAARWYLKAAEGGYEPAVFKMVQIYLNGEGVPKNPTLAFDWATRAAQTGNADAKYLLGYMYYSGSGTVKSLEMAEIYLQEAVDAGLQAASGLLEEVQGLKASPR